MFTARRRRARRTPAASRGRGRGVAFGRWTLARARPGRDLRRAARGAALAEEIETPGEGQVRALITIAGNPVVSTPNAGRLDAALDVARLHGQRRHLRQRDHAPRRRHPARALAARAVRTTTSRFYQLRRSATSRTTRRRCCDPPAGDARRVGDAAARCRRSPPARGRTPTSTALDDFVAASAGARRDAALDDGVRRRESCRARPRGPERLLDLMLRAGPYDADARRDLLEAAPHGIDLGPLRAAAARGAAHAERQDRARARADRRRRRRGCAPALGEHVNGGMVLVGRRDLRSNNSWMHNLPLLVSGPERCTRAGAPRRRARGSALTDGERARVSSRAGAIEVPVEVTERRHAGRRLDPARLGPRRRGRAASRRAPTTPASTPTCWPTRRSSTPLSGNAVLNGIPVEARAGAPTCTDSGLIAAHSGSPVVRCPPASGMSRA